jgi:hypothetical protein
MDLYRIIRELVQERDRLDRLIQSLEEISTTNKIVPRPPGKRRGRKSMDARARAEVSQRMKKYWAQRRAEEGTDIHAAGLAAGE